jgi:uncharacterized protein (DUF2141 family)
MMATIATLTAHLLLSAPSEGTMTFDIAGIARPQGQIGCALFRGEEGFPMQAEKAYRQQFAKIEGRTARCVFEKLPPGVYALSVMHDENMDGKLERSFFGAPKEGWATSNDAPPRTMGPPRWEDAKVQFDGTTFRQTVTIRY